MVVVTSVRGGKTKTLGRCAVEVLSVAYCTKKAPFIDAKLMLY